ncbi:small ribosomal subunit protein mS27 [Procambarus clarkii]|uniref:small ribosomal subunit protein mS27 n=1 Tax=Procambarus clarkii TaxID=6728 RepID=UPI0037445C6E
MALKALMPSIRHIKLNLRSQQYRAFLSAAYRCDEVWNQRLQHPLITCINVGDYFYDLDRKYKLEGKVSAIDVDLFVNKIESSNAEEFVEEIEDLVHRLRRSPETVRMLPSTPHAVLRVLLEAGCTQTLLKMLSDPLNYGIFPDHYTSNLLMDTFLEQKNYTAAARVASVNMLQEDFGPLLTKTLTLASCFLYATSDDNQPWEDYTLQVEEPKEEVKIRVRYLRNPYFDDHFDLKEPDHIVGKTLAWVSPLIGGAVGVSCEVLGWALYNKWTQLEASLNRASEGTESVAASVISRVKKISEACNDAETKERIMAVISRLEASESKVAELDLGSLMVDMIKKAAVVTEPNDIQSQKDTYISWGKTRENEFQIQMEEYKKRQLLAEIEKKKKDLADREEVIFFFDNKEKLEMLLTEKKEKYHQKKMPHKGKQSKDEDEGYIPPEVIRR